MTRRNTRKGLQEGLKDLRLPTMRSSCQEVAQQARAASLSYEDYLLTLVDQERDVRRQGRIARALRASNLPLEKTLEGFDRKRLPRKVDAHVNVLLEGAFLGQCENVLAFGQPGSGRLHSATFPHFGNFPETETFAPREFPERLASALQDLAIGFWADDPEVRASLHQFTEVAREMPTPNHMSLIMPDLVSQLGSNEG